MNLAVCDCCSVLKTTPFARCPGSTVKQDERFEFQPDFFGGATITRCGSLVLRKLFDADNFTLLGEARTRSQPK